MTRLTVRYFAVLRERRGLEVEQLEVPEGSSLAEIYADLFPPGPEGAMPVAFARNQAYAKGDEVPEEGEEIAFLPPLGGG